MTKNVKKVLKATPTSNKLLAKRIVGELTKFHLQIITFMRKGRSVTTFN